MAIPEDEACVSFNKGQEEAERQIKELCRRLLPGWSDLTCDLQVSPISGGISNLLVKVEPPAPLDPVAVKVFGDKTELLIDRAAEKQLLLHLNGVGFGAQVVGLFGNGRIERFLVAKTLTPEEMCDPRFIPYIARRLRAFHDLDLDGAVPAGGAVAAAVVSDGSGTPAAGCEAASQADQPGRSPAASSHWDAIFGWLEMAEGLTFPHDAAKQTAYEKVDFQAMRKELEALRRACERVASPRVLCHNDLLSGNILIVQQQQKQAQQEQQQEEEHHTQACKAAGSEVEATVDSHSIGEAGEQAGTAAVQDADLAVLRQGSLQFIDFEYSCYGPRGFDFGNHFNEYAGFDCVYERFPSAEQQKIFFRHYLHPGELQQLAREHLHRRQHPHPHPNGVHSEDAANGINAASPAVTDGPSGDAQALAEEAVLNRMVAEACVYALASHAYWGVWSFIQARYSPIDFDYLGYSMMRWDEYHRRKDEFLALAEEAFPQ